MASARPFVYADLEAMPDDGYRREILGGALFQRHRHGLYPAGPRAEACEALRDH